MKLLEDISLKKPAVALKELTWNRFAEQGEEGARVPKVNPETGSLALSPLWFWFELQA